MRFPLVVFSLGMVVLWLVSFLRPQLPRLRPAAQEVLVPYVVLAVYAVLSIAFGKPGLMPQYLAWLTVVLTTLQLITRLSDKERVSSILGALALLAVGVLWFFELPFFDVRPP